MPSTIEEIAGEDDMEPQVIKTEAQYKTALTAIEWLIGLDPEPNTREGRRLELLATLVERFEKERFAFTAPDPIDAIHFRMEEQGLRQRDLIPYVGSKSKVSEVLSRKRPLTLQMIRALNVRLGIPADVLLQKTPDPDAPALEINWHRFPIREMAKRGWITVNPKEDVRQHVTELMQEFLAPLGATYPGSVFWRRTLRARSKQPMNKYALLAWIARILIRASEERPPKRYEQETVTEHFMQEIARLSWSDKGPILAKEFLANNGIVLVIEPHLPRTRLDGAAMLAETKDGMPVIGLTLRHDRLDNFWFTLLHELAHVSLHLRKLDEIFLDDLETEPGADQKEKQADRLAAEALIPRAIWRPSRARRQKTPEAIRELSQKLRIHPSIVAGRIRHENRNYHLLNNFVGHGEVRRLFAEAAQVSRR